MDDVVDRIADLLDHGRVLGIDGELIGHVGQIYRDDQTGAATWVSVRGDADESQPLVPLAGQAVEGDDVRVPYDAATIGGAPRVAVGAALSPQEEEAIREYYRSVADRGTSTGAQAATDDGAGPGTRTGTGTVTGDDSAAASVLRSEEQLQLSTQRVPVRRARLEKFQVTEQRTITVPVTRDEVRVVYEDIPDGADIQPAGAGAEMRPWVLMEERVVVTKEMVPVETVRMVVESVTENREVTEQVRKEHVTLQTSPAGAPARSAQSDAATAESA